MLGGLKKLLGLSEREHAEPTSASPTTESDSPDIEAAAEEPSREEQPARGTDPQEPIQEVRFFEEPAGPNGNDAPVSDNHFSDFGGFWTDKRDARQILERRVQEGQYDEQLAQDLEFWIENGYLIIEGAVSHEICDEIHADIQRCIDGELPERTVEGFKPGTPEKVQVPLSMEALGLREAKLLDLHAVSKAARRALFNPRTAAFLKAAFERPPVSFASLTFKYGSTQPLHQDSAFVAIDSPLEFAAAWVALEDIEPGSGELEYVPGSHRMEETLFDGRSKWFIPGSPEARDYNQGLLDRAKRANLEVKHFLPRKGDVLIWSADLAHGGARNIEAGKTRWSLVSHFCPLDRNPRYFYARRFGRKLLLESGHWIASKE